MHVKVQIVKYDLTYWCTQGVGYNVIEGGSMSGGRSSLCRSKSTFSDSVSTHHPVHICNMTKCTLWCRSIKVHSATSLGLHEYACTLSSSVSNTAHSSSYRS